MFIRTANQQFIIQQAGGLRAFIESECRARWNQRPNWEVDGPPVFAYVTHSNWCADCGACMENIVVEPGEPFFCPNCLNAANGGKARPVVFPAERAEIEDILLGRVDPDQRTWLLGWTLDDLRLQELHHSYVSPTNRTTGVLITAAIWNQDLVSNMLAQPVEFFTTKGDLFAATGLKAGDRTPVAAAPAWLIPDTGQTTGVKWQAWGEAEVATAESYNNAAFGDPTTPGPITTVTVGASGMCVVLWHFEFTGTQLIHVGIRVDATDPVNADCWEDLGSANVQTGSTWRQFTGLSAGTHIFKMRYSDGGAVTFSNRKILAIPF